MTNRIKRTARSTRRRSLALLGVLAAVVVATGAVWLGSASGDPTTTAPTLAGTVAGQATTQDLNAIGGSDPNHLWAVGANATIVSNASSPPNFATESSAVAATGLNAVSVVGGSTAWAVGANCAMEITTDGVTWTQVPSPSGCGGATLYGIDVVGGGGGWAVGSGGTILVCSAQCDKATANWSSLGSNPTSSTLNAVAATGNGSQVWAVGANGTVLYCTGTCASTGAPFNDISPSTLSAYTLTGVATNDGKEAWLTGRNGSSGVIAQCASTAACSSSMSSGWTLTTTGAGLNALASGGNNLVYAAGDGGTVWGCFTNCQMTAPVFAAIPGTGATGDLRGVYAKDDNHVVVVGTGGVVDFCINDCNTTSGSTWSVPPANPSYLQTASFSFTAPDHTGGFTCQLDNQPVPCNGGTASFSSLAAGDHTFKVAAVSSTTGTSAQTQYQWKVSLPPAPTITLAPANPSYVQPLDFGFSDQTPVQFFCSLDGAAFTSCSGTNVTTGTAEYNNLTAGKHQFFVYAVSAVGQSPTTKYEWNVVGLAPAAPTITSNRPNSVDPSPPFDPTYQTTARFTYTEPVGKPLSMGPQSMEGDLKASTGDWVSVGWHFKYSSSHPASTVSFQHTVFTFPVTCVDGTTPSQSSWTIPVPDQSYSVAANNTAWTPWSSQQTAASFQTAAQLPQLCGTTPNNIHLNQGAAFSTLVSSDDTTDAIQVQYHYRDPNAKGKGNVNCSDPAQNPDPGNSAVCGASMSATNSMTPGGSAASVQFLCSLDGAPFTNTGCGSGASGTISYSGLTVGPHTFRVKAFVSPSTSSPTEYDWTILASPPYTISGDVPGQLYPGAPAITIPISFNSPNDGNGGGGGDGTTVNNLTVSIGSITGGSNLPNPCTAADFEITQIPAGDYPFYLPYGTSTLASLIPPGDVPTIRMINQPYNQDGCKGATIHLTFTGTP